MEKRKATALLADLQKRVQANQNGLLAVFKATAAPLENGAVTLNTLRVAYSQGLPEFGTAIKGLYTNEEALGLAKYFGYKEGANAEGEKVSTAGWLNFSGNLLSGIGGALCGLFGADSTATEQNLQYQYEAQLAAAEAENQRKIVIGLVIAFVIAVIIGLVIYLRKK